ncbi:MAG: leucine-rich repeat domain-containing protein [Spirosoma sp.]|nr:leucine-rich repeat domain-containing protein [Spirosoma sp.]
MQTLDLSYNQITDISFLASLTRLQTLYLSDNQITDISFLASLTTLQTVNLSDNQITDYSFLASLTRLQALDLSYNQITDISFLASLTTLQTLDLSNNQITDISSLLPFLQIENPLPVSLNRGDDINKLNLYDNPVNIPPLEIVQQGNAAILNYFDDLEKQGREYLYEAKMLIVGQPRAGKTSLRYKLFDQQKALPVEEETTRGIDIQALEFQVVDPEGNPRTFTYNVWDFGGQQIYQSTHQFFLTHRSLYVLVLDTGKDSIGNDDSTMNYWLQAVELLGNNSPMLLLLNQKNERPFTLDLGPKKARFVFLKKEFEIDLNALIPQTEAYKSAQDRAFKTFREDVETELKRLPLVGFPMPRNWVKIREALQQRSLQEPYIYRQEYSTLCAAHDVTDYEKQCELSRIFHDLGVFLHFQDHAALEEFIILRDVWATDAVFAVLDSPVVIKQEGRFTDRDLASIWTEKGYEASVHTKLLALMKQFELCYQVEDSSPRAYILPELLADKPPEGYQWIPQNDLPLQYRYDFMPKGILTRFIVRLHRHIAQDTTGQQLVWKSGIVIAGSALDCPNTRAEVTEAWDSKQLLIRVQGKFPKELMGKLTHDLDAINNAFFKPASHDPTSQKSRWYKMIPCTCRTCTDNPDKYYYDYSELLERKEYGKNTIECKRKPFEAIAINELLDGVFSRNATRQTQHSRPDSEREPVETRPKKIFISYSHKDECEFKDEIVSHLASLRNQDLIESWTDRQLESGQWDAQIEAAMEEADIFLLLITHNFLASEYINSKEIRTAYRRYKEGKAKIFPVICDACKWQLQPVTKDEREFNETLQKEMYVWLGKFQAFPKDALPIKNWPNKHDGFLDVIDQLEKYL